MVCYRTGQEPGGSDLEEKGQSEDLKLAYLMRWPTCFSGRLGGLDCRKCPLKLRARALEKLVEKICDVIRR